MKLILISIFILCYSINCLSQRINNVEATQFGNNVEVTYTVSDVDENEPYAIRVEYTAKSGLSKTMTHTYGDIGTSVTGNGSKKIIWDVLREVDSFEGEYAFKVTLTPSGSKRPISNSTNTTANEGREGKFKAVVKSAKMVDSSIIIKFTLLNTMDNENYKVHITRSKITGPDGVSYLAKSGNQGGKDQYGFMNIVLQKGVEKQIELLFDYVPENITILKSIEIIRYAGIISSEALIISNVDISR